MQKSTELTSLIPKLSVVTTIYNSAATIAEFHKRTTAVVKKVATDYEIIFVIDGTPDQSLDILEELAENDPKVKVIDLSRNFGHHIALMTGMSYAKGSHIFMLDVDLEEEPEWVNSYISMMNSEKQIDVVFGIQKTRKGNFLEKISGYVFWRCFNWLANTKVPENIVTCRLMTSKYVKNLIRFEEREIFIAGLCVLNGFKSKFVEVDKKSTSPTTYSFAKKMALLVNGVTSLSSRPLYFIFYIGMVITILSLGFATNILYRRLTNQIVVDGWTSLSMMILFIGGINLFCNGIMGIYLTKIFIETKRRPYNIIRREINVE